MSFEKKVLSLSYPAAEDLSSDKYRFVVLTSTGVRRPDSETEDALGILQNAPESGEVAEVAVEGVSKLAINGAVTAYMTFLKPEYVSASDAGKGDDAGTQWDYARAVALETVGAEDDIAAVLLVGPFPKGGGTENKLITVTTEATAGAHTYTAAELLGGMILRDCAGGARSDPSPTAALLIAAIAQAGAGNAFEFTIRNTSDAAETITVTAGTDVTLSGTMTIAQNNSKRFLAVVTSGTTVTIYSLGTVVH